MDLAALTLEFRSLHEKAKNSPLTAEEKARWAELKALLSRPVEPDPHGWFDPDPEAA
jgi:hypothetical protein